jgi:hypothetical protein
VKLSPVRGLKFGLANAVLFPLIMATNSFFRNEEIVLGSLVTGAVFAFLFFGLIWTFTDKIGSSLSD